MRAIKIVFASFFALSASTALAFAHVGVKTSNIAANAVIETLPAAFTISFTQPVGLASFTLATANGAPIVLDYAPPKGMAIEYSIPLPRLAPGVYLAKWRTVSKDGHAVPGEIRFTLSPQRQK